jgi:hypothetical protein
VRAGIGGLEAREHLRADGAERAVAGSADDADAAVAVGIGLARGDGVILGAELDAARDLQRGGEAEVGLRGDGEVGRPLLELQLAVVERGRAGVAERDVGRFGRAVIERVVAVDSGEVPVEAAGLALDAAGPRRVEDLGLDVGQEAVRVDRADRAVVARAAEEAGAVGVLLGEAAEEVGFERVAERILAVEPRAALLPSGRRSGD